jgi:hypothetical protein
MTYLGVKRIFVFEGRKIIKHNPAEERGTGGHTCACGTVQAKELEGKTRERRKGGIEDC